MTDSWPAICTAAALVILLLLIIRWKVQAFVALLMVSLGLGLAAGLPPDKVLEAIRKGVGSILAEVAVLLALGAMLGRMLDASGAAEVIARTLIRAFGIKQASFAILVAAYLIGIPVLFNVGFLLLIPIMWRLQRETGESLLRYVLPLAFSLGITHSFIPPHPGIVGAVNILGGDAAGSVMIETILFGTLLGIPLVLVGWFGPGRYWANREWIEPPAHLAGTSPLRPAVKTETDETRVAAPEHLAASPTIPAKETEQSEKRPPSFGMAILVVTLPLLLSLLGFGVKLLGDYGYLPAAMTQPWFQRSELPAALAFLSHSWQSWFQFLGNPIMALLVPTGLAFVFFGMGRGMNSGELSKLATKALLDVGEMAFLFGAAGGFKQVIQDTGAGASIASQVLSLPLSPVAVFYLVAVLARVALGSATAAILTASGLLAIAAQAYDGPKTLLILAVANGVTFMTQPADSGFWLMKEYCNMSVRDVMFKFNACRIIMSLFGLAVLLAYEAWAMGLWAKP